ncbi:MAG: hypothetical protein ACOC9S_03950, partial [Planctomycetota bacterium]
ELDLTLKSCLFHGDQPQEDGPSLLLDARRVDGRWRRLWGMAGNFNVSHPVGRVVESNVTDERIRLKISMKIEGDAWVPGGRAIYTIDLRRHDDGRLEGTYEGTFRFVPVSGRAFGRVRPLEPLPAAFTPTQPGEHPRLLFREHQLEALRSKAGTDFGKAALAKVDQTAAGLGMKYQLTGERKYADAARAEVEKHLADMDNGNKMVRSRVWGWRHEQMALAYDLCYDAWDEDFRREVADHLVYTANRIYHNHSLFHSEITWHLAGTYAGQIMYGSAIGGLAIWGEQGPAPEKPEASFTESREKLTVAAAKDYQPAEDVPIVNFSSGQLPERWLYIAGFKVQGGKGVLDKTGGPAETRPEPGQTVEYGDRKQTWRDLPRTDEFYYKNQISITDAADRRFFTTSYFYTVIRNDRPRWVKLDTGYGSATVYLAGAELKSGDVLKLEEGLYPMMVVAQIGETTPWGKDLMAPKLAELGADAAETEVEHIRALHEEEMADWRFDLAEWKRTDGADQDYQKFFELSRWQMYLIYREAVNDGGYVAGADPALEGSSRYTVLHENMFGRPASPYPDVSRAVPCMIFQHLYGEDGQTLSQDINGSPAFWWDAYHEKRNITGEIIGSLWPVIPDKYKPAVLWAWPYHTDGSDPIELLDITGRPYNYEPYKAHALYMFVHDPFDVKPEHPAEVMPLTWASPGYGWYGFRSGWEGTDEFLTQVYTKERRGSGGRDNAGTFRIIGLGQRWTHGEGKPGGYRFGENVVMVPDINTAESGCATQTHYETRADGGGVVSMDMTELYQSLATDDKGNPRNIYEKYGDIRNDSTFEETGITGLRSIAFDYSGKSGAPCVLVIVDRLDGVKDSESFWAWQLESERTKAPSGSLNRETGLMEWQGMSFPYDPGAIIKTESQRIDDSPLANVENNTFTMRRDDANLRGTVIGEGNVNLEFAEKTAWTVGYKRRVSETSSKAIFASAEGHGYFVIVTIQQGEPPAIEIEGEGLDATVKVGDQTVRFDGEKIVFGK